MADPTLAPRWQFVYPLPSIPRLESRDCGDCKISPPFLQLKLCLTKDFGGRLIVDAAADFCHPRKKQMNKTVTHDRGEESIEAKTRWFKSLPLSERMEMFCAFTDLALTLNPDLADRKNAQQTERRVRIISAA